MSEKKYKVYTRHTSKNYVGTSANYQKQTLFTKDGAHQESVTRPNTCVLTIFLLLLFLSMSNVAL